jgi:two-component system, OmpR family, KDP operon response regulator KdpE
MSGTTLLLVDDEPSIQRATATLLRSRGYAVTVAGTGSEALEAFDRDRPGLVILDLGLPDMDGTSVCRQLRARSDVPILVLSVRGGERSKVEALDAGADDYVTKPFGPEELLARIRAGLRRSAGSDKDLRGRLERGDLVIDFDKRRAYRQGQEIRLTPKEFDLLTLLAAHGGCVLTHRAIAKSLWGPNGGGQQEHLRVLVGQLRKKLEPDPAHPRYVLTEPWVGYRFALDGPDPPER